MNTSVEPWIKVGELSDIPRQGARCVVADEKKIAIFRTLEDKVFALEDNCPHKGGPLSQGIVHDDCVTCPLHNWVISLPSGEALGADSGTTQQFPVKLDGDAVLIDLSSLYK